MLLTSYLNIQVKSITWELFNPLYSDKSEEQNFSCTGQNNQHKKSSISIPFMVVCQSMKITSCTLRLLYLIVVKYTPPRNWPSHQHNKQQKIWFANKKWVMVNILTKKHAVLVNCMYKQMTVLWDSSAKNEDEVEGSTQLLLSAHFTLNINFWVGATSEF